jgi:hypothetical protein
MASDFDKDSLKIGDLVLFKDVALGVHMCSEGIIIEDIVGSSNVEDTLHDGIFTIHLQRQYSASRELNDFLASYIWTQPDYV